MTEVVVVLVGYDVRTVYLISIASYGEQLSQKKDFIKMSNDFIYPLLSHQRARSRCPAADASSSHSAAAPLHQYL